MKSNILRMYLNDTPPKVMGIGLNKTGTTTLAKCFNILGYKKHVTYNGEVILMYLNKDLDSIFNVIKENESFEDWPFPLIYQEVFFRFGRQVKFVLTMRKDPVTWLESLKKHSLRTNPENHFRLIAYGYNYPHGFEKQHLEFYEKHNREVIEFFQVNDAMDQLLKVQWDSGDGWEKLCGFLGRPIPPVPFPHENNSRIIQLSGFELENQKRIDQQLDLLRNSD